MAMCKLVDYTLVSNQKLTKLNKYSMHLDLQQRQVKSFLGLVGYYRDYIPHFASIAVPLTDLLRKGQPTKVDWGEAQQKAFASLKHSLTGSPILHVPDFDKVLSLSCRRMHLTMV